MILAGHARTLTQPELRGAVARLALRPDVWTPLVRHDPDQRVYEELYRDEHVSAWVICWMPGQDTGLHDHDGASGAVAVVSGSVLERRVGPHGDVVGSVYSRSEVFDFGPEVVHGVSHRGALPATTLHAYSPPLSGMGAYVEQDGRLRRRALTGDQELRPLDVA